MDLIIAGGRDFTDKETLYWWMDLILSRTSTPIHVIAGGAKGADTLAIDYAKDRGYTWEIIPANWTKHRNAAGPIRNREMAELATHLVAFWDGKSKGTKDMINVATKKGLSYRYILYED